MKMENKVMLTFFTTAVLAVLISLAGYFGLSGIHLAAALILGSVLVLAMGFFLHRNISANVSGLVAEHSLLTQAVQEGRLSVRGDASKVNPEFQEIIQGFNKSLDAMNGPLNVAAEYMDKIGKGETRLPIITETFNGDFNKIKDSLNACIHEIGILVDEVGVAINAAREGKLDQRSNAERTVGVYRKILRGVNDTVDALVGPLNMAAEYVDRISKGDMPPVITDDYKGDYNEIKNNLNGCIGSVNGLLEEVNSLIRAVRDGELDTRGNAAVFAGAWGELVVGMNGLLEAVAEPVDELKSVLGRVAVNDLTQKMDKEYNGVWYDLKNATNEVIKCIEHIQATLLNVSVGDLSELEEAKKAGRRSENDRLVPSIIKMMDAIKNLADDAAMLTGAAMAGKLDIRADAARHDGEYRKIIEEFNNTLDAVIGPLNVAAEYVDRISKGDMPPKITDSYNGDFNEIKNNLNTCIDSINSIIEEMGNLYTAHNAGNIDFYIPEESFAGAYREMAAGVNKTVKIHVRNILHIIKIIKAYAEGDFSPVLQKLAGKMAGTNEIVDLVKNNLQSLITEVKNLVQAVRDGRLETRSNAAAFAGDWGQLVGDMNSLMEAVAEPVDELMAVLGRMAVNDFTLNMEKEYSGVWNELKAYANRVTVAIRDLQNTTKKISNGDLSDLDMLKGIGQRSDNDELVPAYIQMIEAIKELVVDANMVAEAVAAGNLAVRADDAKHGGDFRMVVEGLNRTMDAVSEPVNEMLAVVDRVALNDVTLKMEKEYRGAWNDLKNGVNSFIRIITHIQNTVIKISRGDLSELENDKKVGRRCENDELMPAMIKMMESIRGLADDAVMLTGAAMAGKLDVRADVTKHNGEYRRIIEEFNGTLDALIGPLNVAAEYIDRISKGEMPPQITDNYSGDFNEIKNNLNTCIDSISSVVTEMNNLYEAQSAGDADYYIQEEHFSGFYQQMVTGVNQSVKIHVRNTLKILKVVSAYAEGDFSKILEKLPGKQVIANEKMDLIRNNLLSLINEINTLVHDARLGKLDTRGNEAAFAGHWGKLVAEMNGLMEAVAGPVGELQAVLDRLAVNDLTRKMVNEYSGVWDELKGDINSAIDQVANIERVLVNIGNGNLDDLDGLKKIGQRSDNDKLVPAGIHMIEAIRHLLNDAEELAQAAIDGKLDTRADASRHEGEYRKIIDGFNKTLDAVLNPINEAVECLKEMAGGNLDVAVTGNYKGDHAIIKDALNKTLEAINETMGQVTIAMEQVNTGAWQVSDSSQSLSQGAAESASTMEQLTSSMNEMNSQTKQNADNAMQANQLATQARSIAEKGNNQMIQMVRAMSDINESAANISKIIKAIDEIAFQTNILALNAAVEAARAGKHGKGFTVVAEEVRNLAQRSAKAAKETAEMIEGSIQKTEIGAKIAEETSKALEEIVLGTAKVTDLIGEIASASKEQAVGIGQINEGLNQVDQVTQQNSAGSEELAAASEEMSSQAAMVKQMLDKFTLRKQGFTVAPAVAATTKSLVAHQPPVQERNWGIKNKPVKKGVLEVAAAKDAGVKPQDIISLNDAEFGNF
ncbi:Methyl-accepting chemotaxis protein II [Pelotomaculum schinkii]|uniref:Methyl-accepting chemotaxis protein II n=2 Tax=Pelotomaculum TaxID=191373 RepID=A0A4Y7R824_9FIRM|nr:methyl-accepting chemotaxis protein [Pelotomaculum schinkii]TEB04927.1 Methyl-accepting chemotaxis protein II [Pelotomaculum schinkii]